MMKVSTCTLTLVNAFGLEKGMKLVADAGFDGVDFSLTANTVPWDDGIFCQVSQPEFAEHFRNLAKTIRGYGLELYQCHAPFINPLYAADPKAEASLVPHMIRSIYAAGYMECPDTVTHAVMHPDFNNGRNPERCLQANLEFFGKFVPALKDAGVTMCIENVFLGGYGQPKIPNACSGAAQLIELIDTLNDLHGPHFAACLDTGHAVVTGNDPAQMLRNLGERTHVLHVHDNGGVLDDHLLPGRGIINWTEVARTLGEVNYQGVFNFETSCYMAEYCKPDIFNKAVVRAATDLLCLVGRSLTDIAEKARGNFSKQN